MAAYAALVSLMNDLEQIQNHPRHSFSFDKKQIESLCENVGFLLEFLERSSHERMAVAEDLESEITSAAYEAEDVIESHAVDQINAGCTLGGEMNSCVLDDLQRVIERMDSIKQKAMEVKPEGEFKDELDTYPTPATSSKPPTSGKNTMVGFDDVLVQVTDMLTGGDSSRQIIPIVGMGGIGKTTVAENAYEYFVQHFDFYAWATVSQTYNVKDILSVLLCRQTKSTTKTVHELGGKLHKSLFGRRYLIILDDMWSMEAWDEIQQFFPDNANGSRIVITTRLSDVANRLSSSPFQMNFLDEDKSWKLFCDKAFGGEDCPHDLKEIGQKIVKKCRGLPLSILVIGGHFAKSSRRKEYWENVANDIYSILSSEDELCMEILFLSYSHLPIYLKPCFLYMGTLEEDERIFACDLIDLWVAEGFLRPNEAQSLEEVAEGYLKDLVDRNLISLHLCSWNGKIKTCSIHDLLRELCLKAAEKEKFFCVLDTPQPRDIHSERRVVIHESIPEVKQSAPLVRSLKCMQGKLFDCYLKCKGGELLSDFKLLRVLNRVHRIPCDVHPRTYKAHDFQQVNLRYLDCQNFESVYRDSSLYLPSSISLLWNLQTLIIRGGYRLHVVAPSEIWEMPQLRHLEFDTIYLPDPLPSDRSDLLVLKNLRTLIGVATFRLSEEVCKRIPNIKELQISYKYFPGEPLEARSYYDELTYWFKEVVDGARTYYCRENLGCFDKLDEACSYYCPQNLGCFNELESLKCRFSLRWPSVWRDFVLGLAFPRSLKEVCLSGCGLGWQDVTKIGLSLPYLEVLELGEGSVAGAEWELVEENIFCRLKFLQICNGDLYYWKADDSNFPVLEKLVLHSMSGLYGIPPSFGEISTLQLIRLDQYCSVSASISAAKILAERERHGNEDLQVEVEFFDKEQRECFTKMVQEMGLTRKNLRVSAFRHFPTRFDMIY